MHAKMGAERAESIWDWYTVQFRAALSGKGGGEVGRAGTPPTNVALKISEGVH